jgi:hypothetical protein
VEIVPENPAQPGGEFVGLRADYVSELLGGAVRAVLYRIEHDVLEFGPHLTWTFGTTWYTAAGLLRIIEELHARGFTAEASALRLHIDRRRAATAKLPQNPLSEDPILAKRWDLKREIVEV